MRPISKETTKVIVSLMDHDAQNAFDQNIASANYVSKDIYRNFEVRKELNELYHKKCAYCEDTLLNHFKHIEHYRPKSIYFWLAFSWDNLLLACEYCNVNKRKKFRIQGIRINYQNETFQQIQTITQQYDKIEIPSLLNPEQVVSFEPHFTFNLNGEIVEISDKMKYTIETCDLNRIELIEKRYKILKKLRDKFLRRWKNYNKNMDYNIIQAFKDLKEDFIEETNETTPFTAWRLFIIENFDNYVKTIFKK